MIRLSRWAGWIGSAAFGVGLLAATPAFAAAPASLSGHAMNMVATAYGPSAQDNYPYGATDYFGKPLVAGDVAVDPSVIPLHTCVYVTGYHSPNLPAGGFIGEADDEGSAIQGNRVDLFMNASPAKVSAFGIQRVQVTILGKPTNPQTSGTAACAGYAGQIGQASSAQPTSSAQQANSTGSVQSQVPGPARSFRPGSRHLAQGSPQRARWKDWRHRKAAHGIRQQAAQGGNRPAFWRA
jgi:3D (Asp-Asp-Asp) domain-containing protein